ncbi:MAG TPA: FAD-dependent oxidoreductase [Thermoplasmata archaeon]|nr:FAD-dependent oxidoreductase [Thermoplasmata archaeon]
MAEAATTGSHGEGLPLVVLGAGYAGLTVAQEVDRRSRGKIPVVLVDRNPVHVLRTELYEIGKLVATGTDTEPWTIPLAQVLDRTTVTVRQGSVQSIDLGDHSVSLDTGVVRFRSLAICLGNVAAYYGVPGAAEYTHQVYRLSGAKKLAEALRGVETASVNLAGERRPRVLIIGGGSTGTELAAEIATTDWPTVSVPGARRPDVFQLTGSLPFLAGFAPGIIDRARKTLARAGVTLVHGYNVTRVDPGRLTTEDGSVFAFDAAVWCAGLEAPPTVRQLTVPHGRAGRVAVEPTLELPGHPGVFAVGDVAELKDPTTGQAIPATAQAALAEARVAAKNLVARWNGTRLDTFEYHERGVVVALGIGQAAGTVRRVPIWGSPAAVLKRIVQHDYAHAVGRGETPTLI